MKPITNQFNNFINSISINSQLVHKLPNSLVNPSPRKLMKQSTGLSLIKSLSNPFLNNQINSINCFHSSNRLRFSLLSTGSNFVNIDSSTQTIRSMSTSASTSTSSNSSQQKHQSPMSLTTSALVDVDWLFNEIEKSISQHGNKLCILDASWYLPTFNRDVHAEFRREHICSPCTQFFDLDANSDTSSSLPHMFPTTEHFERVLTSLGIENDTKFVIYDSHGMFSAPRVWYTFKLFGHANVHILNGGLPEWKAKGMKVVSSSGEESFNANSNSKKHPYKVTHFNADMVTPLSIIQSIANASSSACTLLDARPAARFNGTAPEPRPNVPSGHIPNSINLPFMDLIAADPSNTASGWKLKSVGDLHAVFKSECGITFPYVSDNGDRPVIVSCGTGVTASIIAVALNECGHTKMSLYDGSWAEYATTDGCVRKTK